MASLRFDLREGFVFLSSFDGKGEGEVRLKKHSLIHLQLFTVKC